MSIGLARITYPDSAVYAPSFVAYPDSEPGDQGVLDLEVGEVPVTSQPSSSKSSAVQVRRHVRGNDTIGVGPANLGDQKPPTLAYPSPKTLPSSSNIQEIYCGYKDGNVRLWIGTRLFLLHEHKLEEFSTLKKMIEEAAQSASQTNTDRSTRNTIELRLDENHEDFAKMVKVLYTPIYKHAPSTDYLKSTLRLATKYNSRALRSYAIQRLEEKNLSPIERIILAQSSNVPSWRKKALDELCAQDEPITLTEAGVLGMETFVELAHRREEYKLSRQTETPPPDETQDPPEPDNLEDQPKPRPQGRPRKNPLDCETRTLRKSSRLNPGNRRSEPYRGHRS
ncbi:unnamed protein product [Rhizoctonia solani]|uniref:BTB domain-containing protein n=1 Tax=Rhizoctonia solani TaxID=456999 RepID=A0A8H3HU15_9AGAM|nr:unnamed protein product [Rhizoctonia solani]